MNPSLLVSKGRDAFSGSSLKDVARVCKIWKEAIPNLQIVASQPPATQTSTLPERTASKAFPIASVLDAQAVAIVWEGPFIP